MVLGIVAALALIASVVGAFVASGDGAEVDLAAEQASAEDRSREGDGGEAAVRHPAEWDERVEHLVTFVERERGLEFEHPVQIDFLAREEFAAEIEKGYEELGDEERADVQDALPIMRALGLMAGEFDVLDTMTDLSRSAVAAFYDPDQKRIVAPTTDPTVSDEVVLVHELTHALQDQHFDLNSMLPEDADGDDRSDPDEGSTETAVRALVEGDAQRIEDAYFDTLSSSEQEDFAGAQSGQVGDAEAILEQVPSALIAIFMSPYSLGAGFASMLAAEGGNDAVDRAFQDPPTSSTQLVDPRRYIQEEDPRALEPPDVPAGGEPLEDGEFGVLDGYLMLAERIDPLDALSALDQWSGDSYVVYEDGTRVCLRIAVESPTARGLAGIRSVFQQWAAAAPPTADAEVLDRTALSLLVQTCDPGPDATLPNDRSAETLSLLGGRSEVASTLMTQWGVGVSEAWPVADCYIRGVYDVVSADPGLQQEGLEQGQYEDILRGCAA